MADETYVTNGAWTRQAGRPDLIDDVADQFERPVPDGRVSFWSRSAHAEWPRASRGWQSIDLPEPRTLERAG